MQNSVNKILTKNSTTYNIDQYNLNADGMAGQPCTELPHCQRREETERPLINPEVQTWA